MLLHVQNSQLHRLPTARQIRGWRWKQVKRRITCGVGSLRSFCEERTCQIRHRNSTLRTAGKRAKHNLNETSTNIVTSHVPCTRDDAVSSFRRFTGPVWLLAHIGLNYIKQQLAWCQFYLNESVRVRHRGRHEWILLQDDALSHIARNTIVYLRPGP